MATNINMGKFLKSNVLDTISKKYKFDPERSLPYLIEITRQLQQVQDLVDETTMYMNSVREIKGRELIDEFVARQGSVELDIEYPFNEGDDYWTIENGKIVWSCWDDQSEELYREGYTSEYFKTESQARDFLMQKTIGDESK